ncbi:phosphatidylglycerol lysyltransferase domain-containing protein [Sphingosinicella soli]|uniref:Phosphatidylglycerol lysyltransferase C-terminal domain-containing protein n=1 Tax=Sphingosinicella soli TaxID=333708 RepID=A0A7W7FA56_9SPHN|nr:phosphatidylglycerol lysyltransferase domain-containing protein [Sphingosinicella soli]MBB4633353.1 hypothetical protein [Sphingosinicella soli]
MARYPVRAPRDAEPRVAGSDGVELTLALAPRIAPSLARRREGLAERTPADLTFGNLWLFRGAHQWRWHDGPWPCISGVTYDGQRSALPLFDLRTVPRDVLHSLAARHGALFPLCEREAGAVRTAGFELASHRDDADYVYRAEAFRSYQGRALRKKANLMAQLLAAHVVDVEPYGPHVRDVAQGVLGGWMQDKGKAPGDADEAACRDALGFAPELRLQGFLYRADGQPAGFLLAEPLQDGVWAIRFAKGLARFKGIAQYMFHHFACHGGCGGNPAVDWLNFEQDLGLANFRRTKMSYRPAFLLPKWRLLPPTA